jgi:hypothetical protein
VRGDRRIEEALKYHVEAKTLVTRLRDLEVLVAEGLKLLVYEALSY